MYDEESVVRDMTLGPKTGRRREVKKRLSICDCHSVQEEVNSVYEELWKSIKTKNKVSNLPHNPTSRSERTK